MVIRPCLRLLILSQLCILFLASYCTPIQAAIGVYNFTATATGSAMPIQVDYRLNCDGEVTIEIHDGNDAPVATLGPFQETIGVHSHTWDNGGNPVAGGNYRAVIKATGNYDSASLGTLVPMFADQAITASIYGLAIDRFAESPAYGTIYVSQATGSGGRLLAYYADGTPKNWSSPNGVGNALPLGLGTMPATAPWGIGVDKLGNVYVSCTLGVASAGVSVFDYQGNKLPYVLQADPSGIVWLDGLSTANGVEVYETKGATVRYSVLSGDHWTTAMDPGIVGATIKTKGICFETGGSACYVATYGKADSGDANPGITRFVRQADGSWTKDPSFDMGLSQIMFQSPNTAAYYAWGVSCDARDPDQEGPYTASSLWVGFSIMNGDHGNIARRKLPNGPTTLFTGPLGSARFVAADSVGNVAYEYGASYGNYPVLWSHWRLWSPGGEESADTRATNWVAIAAPAQRKIVDKILDLKNEPPDSQVQLPLARRVTAVFADCFYIEEDDRSSGIRVKCSTPVSEGSYVKLGGRMSSEGGERCLADAEVITP